MDLLIDTQALVWIGIRPSRLPPRVQDAIVSPGSRLHLSAVVAYEFADLNRRKRFGADLPLDEMILDLGLKILPYPADIWRIAERLPPIHRDPVDRMLIAHALHADLTLVTADATIRSYPVRTLW